MGKVGRPLKFKSPEELQKKVDAYFASLVEEVWEKVLVDGGLEVDKMVWVPVLDRHEKQTFRFKENPTITGMALFLDTSRETLMDYQENDKFSDTVKKAKVKIEYYTENSKDNDAIKIFKLKNFGWKDSRDINHGGGEKPIAVNTDCVDLKDRIKDLAREIMDDVLR